MSKARKYDLCIIGGGPAGISAARLAAFNGATVALFERDRLGGNSLNTGCIPSKSIIRTGRLYADIRDARALGAESPPPMADNFAETMQRARDIQARIARHESPESLAADGIDVFFGAVAFSGPRQLTTAGGENVFFKKALVCTGSRARDPDIPGLADIGYQSNETVFAMAKLPERMMVIGGGPLGCELAQAFCRLGCKVSLVHSEPKFLPMEERDAAQLLSDALSRDGVEIHLNTVATAARMVDGKKQVDLLSNGYAFSVTVDEVLTGTGRAPNVEGLGLEKAGVKFDTQAGIGVDDFLCTSNSRVYAAGDVCLPYKFTHMAEASADMAVRNALFFGHCRLSRRHIPWCTYTDPEIAHIGLYVDEANALGIPLKTYTILMLDVDRAITDGEDEGFVKIQVLQGTERIMGATIVARHAGEMINEISLAMQAGIGLSALTEVIHAYPTQAGAIKLAADACRRDRQSGLTRFLNRLSLIFS